MKITIEFDRNDTTNQESIIIREGEIAYLRADTMGNCLRIK